VRGTYVFASVEMNLRAGVPITVRAKLPFVSASRRIIGKGGERRKIRAAPPAAALPPPYT